MFPDADDITGNGGVGAVFGIDEAGTLWAYPLEAGPRLGQPVLAGTGFAAETLRPIVYQRPFSESSTHGLVGVVCDGLLYRHDVGYDQKVWLAKQIGNGWDGYQVAALGPPAAEYDDAVFDLYGASQLSGDLFLYRNRDGVFQYPYPKTGNGWQGFELWSAGDLNKDGLSDIFGISPAGDLYLYYGSPDGGFTTKSKVGYGWSGFDIAPGTDIDGDKLEDLVSRDAEGRLFFYRGLGEGRFATKVQIADGWGPLDPGPDCSASGPGELVILPWQQPLVAYTFF
jgi:hypothetical protein